MPAGGARLLRHRRGARARLGATPAARWAVVARAVILGDLWAWRVTLGQSGLHSCRRGQQCSAPCRLDPVVRGRAN